MVTKPGAVRFDTETAIAEALAGLAAKGVHRETLETTLIALAPVDLDLLAIVLRRYDMADVKTSETSLAA